MIRARLWLLVSFGMIALMPNFAAAEMRWLHNIEDAKRLAAQSNRLVLVHFWSTTCPPCVKLDKQVYSQPGIQEELGTVVVPVKINVEVAPGVARQYGVQFVPTDVLLSADGQIISRQKCPLTRNAYVSGLQQAALAHAKRMTGRYNVAAATPAPGFQAQAAAAAKRPEVQVAQHQVAVAPDVGDRYANLFAAQGSGAGPPAQNPAPPPAAAGQPGITQTAAAQQQAAANHAQAAFADMAVASKSAVEKRYGGASAAAMPAYRPTPNYPPQVRQTSNPPGAVVQNSPPGFQPSTSGAYATQPPLGQPNPSLPKLPSNSTVAQSPFATRQPQSQPRTQSPPPEVARQQQPPIALEGSDPIELIDNERWVPGNQKWGAKHRGHVYLFAGAAQQQRFLQNPDRYTPALSGHDPVLAVDQQQMVVGKRRHGLFSHGRVFLFTSEATLAQFHANEMRYLAAVRQAEAGSAIRR